MSLLATIGSGKMSPTRVHLWLLMIVVVVDGCCCCCCSCCCCCGGGRGGGGGGVLQGSHQKRGSNIPKAVNLAELGPTEASKYVTNSVS